MKQVYFDNASTSFPKPACVKEAVCEFLGSSGGALNRGSYTAAYETGERVFETRQLLCDLFHFPDCQNVVFTPNVTTSLNIVLKGLLRPGDHVLVSKMEHNAVMRPLSQLALQGITYDRIPCNPTGELLLPYLDALIKPQTKAIVLTHASNVCGTLMPIAAVGAFCRSHGLYLIVDAAQTAGVFPINMEAMKIDALCFTGHKSLLGPQGIGGILISSTMVPKITALIGGGTGSSSHLEEMPAFMPDKLEAGTLNLPGIIGLHAALRYLQIQHLTSIRHQELALTAHFLEGLKNIPGIRIVGKSTTTERCALVSLQTTDMDLARAAFLLDRDYGIMTRVGLHCAPQAHKTLGTFPEGTIRFSFSHFNTLVEIDYALEALEEICHLKNVD